MIYLKTYKKPEYNRKEILRYMCCKKADENIDALIDECIEEIGDRLTFKISCADFDIKKTEDGLDLGFMLTKSKGLAKNLNGCNKIILFAATVGIEIDRLIERYRVISPSKSIAFQAIGAERVESLCDEFQAEVEEVISQKGKYIRPRFSAGYGDFELKAQKPICEVLDCSRKLGITLNDSLLMSPSKSVTAIIGIGCTPLEKCVKGCMACDKTDCEYRNI